MSENFVDHTAERDVWRRGAEGTWNLTNGTYMPKSAQEIEVTLGSLRLAELASSLESLEALHLTGTVTAEDIETLGALPGIRRVHLRNSGLEESQLLALARHKGLERVQLMGVLPGAWRP